MRKTQRIRVIIQGITIYTTVGKVAETFGDKTSRDAVTRALGELLVGGINGICVSYGELAIQVDLL